MWLQGNKGPETLGKLSWDNSIWVRLQLSCFLYDSMYKNGNQYLGARKINIQSTINKMSKFTRKRCSLLPTVRVYAKTTLFGFVFPIGGYGTPDIIISCPYFRSSYRVDLFYLPYMNWVKITIWIMSTNIWMTAVHPTPVLSQWRETTPQNWWWLMKIKLSAILRWLYLLKPSISYVSFSCFDLILFSWSSPWLCDSDFHPNLGHLHHWTPSSVLWLRETSNSRLHQTKLYPW